MNNSESTLNLLGRDKKLFESDLDANKSEINKIISESSFLVIGGAGSIGQSVAIEIFKRNPKKLHVVDISENNMVELVRGLRSTLGYISGDFRTFAIDCGEDEFKLLCKNEGPYDYIFNLSALKHVRSEKDPYTLMRMLKVNIFNTIETVRIGKKMASKKYFCVSTDKAANPVNMMGASKRIMELFLMRESSEIPISMARFANVAFSDGSLLHGFNQRFIKRQPIAAPNDVKRYFITPQESGELCMLSGLFGENRDIYFPKLNEDLDLVTFSHIAKKFIKGMGFEPHECESEDEARSEIKQLILKKKWPCYFFESDTTGEKDFEEFFTDKEELDMKKFIDIGVIKNSIDFDDDELNAFSKKIIDLQKDGSWNKIDILEAFKTLVPDFDHKETGKYLDSRM